MFVGYDHNQIIFAKAARDAFIQEQGL